MDQINQVILWTEVSIHNSKKLQTLSLSCSCDSVTHRKHVLERSVIFLLSSHGEDALWTSLAGLGFGSLPIFLLLLLLGVLGFLLTD